MKNIILSLLCISYLFNTTFAKDMVFGFRLGENSSVLKGDYGVGTRKYTDYSGFDTSFTNWGVFLDYELKKNLRTQVEINNKTKRMYFTSKQGLIGADWNGQANFNYLEIPVLLKYSIGKRFRTFVNSGLVLNFLLSGGDYTYHTWGSHSGGVSNTYNSNIKSDFHTFTMGVLAGIGFEWNIFENIVLLSEARLTYDITNAAKNKRYMKENSDNLYFNNTRFLSVSTDISLAYKFEL